MPAFFEYEYNLQRQRQLENDAYADKKAAMEKEVAEMEAQANKLLEEADSKVEYATIIQAIQKEVKQLNQTKDSLRGKEDTDLYVSTEMKLDVLSKYLPAQMTEQELEEFISKELSVLVSKTKGMAMKTIMPQIKGRADGKLAVKIINRLLK